MTSRSPIQLCRINSVLFGGFYPHLSTKLFSFEYKTFVKPTYSYGSFHKKSHNIFLSTSSAFCFFPLYKKLFNTINCSTLSSQKEFIRRFHKISSFENSHTGISTSSQNIKEKITYQFNSKVSDYEYLQNNNNIPISSTQKIDKVTNFSQKINSTPNLSNLSDSSDSFKFNIKSLKDDDFSSAVAHAKKSAQSNSLQFSNKKTTFPFSTFKVTISLILGLITSGYIYSYCLENNLTLQQFFHLLSEKLEENQILASDFFSELFEKYFPLSSEPLLPDTKELNYPDNLPTLVIDFDKTVAHLEHHRKTGWQVIKRPGADRFFKELMNYYEIIIWSDDVFPIANDVAMKWGIPVVGCLHRDQCTKKRGHYIKDLSRLGRKLERTIIIDHDPVSFMLQPENGLIIKEYNGDTEDTELESYIDLLKSISLSTDDVRTRLSKYQQYGTNGGYQFLMEKAATDKKAEVRRTFGKAFGLGSIPQTSHGSNGSLSLNNINYK